MCCRLQLFCDFSWGDMDSLLIPARALMIDPRNNFIKVSSVNQYFGYSYSQEYGQTVMYKGMDNSKTVAL